MKKILTVVVVIVLSLNVFTACGNENDNSIGKHQDINLEAKVPYYDNISELEEASDCIVYGEKIDQSAPIIQNDVNDGGMIGAYTLSDFKIIKIISDSTNNLKKGSTIPVYENEAYDKKENITYHVASYNMMEMNNKYLLYLRYSESDGWYIPTGVTAGKVPIDLDEENIFLDDENANEQKENQKLNEEAMIKYSYLPWD